MLKVINSILIFFLFWFNSLSAQNNFKLSASHSNVELNVLHPNDSPYINSTVIFKGNKGTNITSSTNNLGIVKVRLPIGDKYSIHCGQLVNDHHINIHNRGYGTWTGTRYTYRFLEFTFEYLNLNNIPLKDELITIKLSSGKIHEKTTDKDGKVKFYLPINEPFKLSAKYYPYIEEFIIPDSGYEVTTLFFSFQGIGTKEKELRDKQQKEKEIQMAKQRHLNDSIKRVNDSIRIVKDSIRSTQPSTVIFYAVHPEYKSLGEITVYDGGRDSEAIGSTNTIWKSKFRCYKGSSSKNSEVVTSKYKGIYHYYAKSSGGYEWEGSYDVHGGGLKKVILEINKAKEIQD